MSKKNIYYTNNPKKDNDQLNIKYYDRESTIADVQNPLANEVNPIQEDSSESLPLDKLVGIAVDILKKTTEKDNIPLANRIEEDSSESLPLDKLVGIAVDILKKKTENDNVPLDKLVGIAVDILKKKTENDNVPLDKLVGIAVDILKKTTERELDKGFKGFKGFKFKGFLTPFNSDYALPTMTVRLKDIKIFTTDTNYYDSNGSPVTPPESDESDEQSPESNVKPISRIVPVYDGMNNVKITAYTIEDYANGENSEKNEKIINELNLAEIKLTDLQNPEKKQEIMTNIIENLKKDHDVDGDTEKLIQEYLDKLGDAVSKLKGNVDGLGEDVDQIVKNINN